jgi:hypothetical protein
MASIQHLSLLQRLRAQLWLPAFRPTMNIPPGSGVWCEFLVDIEHRNVFGRSAGQHS